MDRRKFLACSASLPLLAACAGPTKFDRSKFGAIARIGIADVPIGVMSLVSRSGNMYAQAGEDSAIMDKLRAKLGTRIDGFTKMMREEIAERCKSRGIATETIAFHPQPGILNPALRAANYPGTPEKFILEPQASVLYGWHQGAIVPGAFVFMRLISGGSDVAWRSSIAVGAPWPNTPTILLPSRRYSETKALFDAPADQIADDLMALAKPLGVASGELLLSAVA